MLRKSTTSIWSGSKSHKRQNKKRKLRKIIGLSSVGKGFVCLFTCKLLLLSFVFKQLYERRKKYATGQEVSVMQSLSEKYMTDEETDSDDDTTLVKRSLPWRSTKCERFLKTLDDRYVESREKKNNSKPLKPRKVGPNSECSPPQNVVSWAIQEGVRLNDQSRRQNGENQQSMSPTTPNTSFTNPSPSGASTPFSSAPSLVSTPPNSAAGSAASLSPSDSPVQLNNNIDDDSDLEGWIRNVAGMT